MNRFYLFSSWVAIFFIVLTGLFLIASCFYVLQLCLLNRKNKRFKKQNQEPINRQRNYGKNLQLVSKLESKIKIVPVNKKEAKRTKKLNKELDEVDKPRNPSCFQKLFRIRKSRNQKQEDNLNKEFTLNDYLDCQTQSYESFETMTTDSECYRDWRYGSILNLNNYPYNNHNNEIIQKAYEQIYAQQQYQDKRSNSSLNKDEITVPVNDLFPISVVPYDFEPQPIHLYKNDNQQLNTNIEIHQTDQKQNLNQKLKDKKSNKEQSTYLSETIKKDTIITIQDGKIKQKLINNSDLNKDNLDRNMNLLTEN